MLTKNRILLMLGAWIALIPFLGFPSSYKSFFIIASGLIVVLLSFLHAREKRRIQKSLFETVPNAKIINEVYAESKPSFWNKENIRENFEQN